MSLLDLMTAENVRYADLYRRFVAKIPDTAYRSGYRSVLTLRSLALFYKAVLPGSFFLGAVSADEDSATYLLMPDKSVVMITLPHQHDQRYGTDAAWELGGTRYCIETGFAQFLSRRTFPSLVSMVEDLEAPQPGQPRLEIGNFENCDEGWGLLRLIMESDHPEAQGVATLIALDGFPRVRSVLADDTEYEHYTGTNTDPVWGDKYAALPVPAVT